MKKEGIKELMDKQRYRPSHMQKSLIEKEVPGSWTGRSGLQNVYNLIEGRVMPKDGYVFIFLSEFLQVSLREILMKYTKKEHTAVVHDGANISW